MEERYAKHLLLVVKHIVVALRCKWSWHYPAHAALRLNILTKYIGFIVLNVIKCLYFFRNSGMQIINSLKSLNALSTMGNANGLLYIRREVDLKYSGP